MGEAKRFKLFILFKCIISVMTDDKECRNMSRKYLSYETDQTFNNTQAVFSKFNSFSELKMECDQKFNITKIVLFLPKKPCILDKYFMMENFFNQYQISFIKKINLVNLKGIDIQTVQQPPKHTKLSNYEKGLILGIYLSKFDAYAHHTLIDSSNCDLTTYNSTNSFFNSLYGVSFVGVVYPKSVCPYLFENSSIAQMVFTDIRNSFLSKNRLNILELNQTSSIKIRMKHLKALSFILSYEILTSKIFNAKLFGNVEELVIEGVVNGMQSDLFKEIKSLKNINLQINNLKNFFHAGNNWMLFINYYISVNLKSKTSIQSNMHNFMRIRFQNSRNFNSFISIYEYPNEDICLFKDFPHNRLVLPILSTGKLLDCTCTLKWLQYYSNIYNEVINIYTDYSDNYQQILLSEQNSIFDFCINFNATNCNFEKIFKNCRNYSIFYIDKSWSFLKLNNDVDIFYLIKWLQYLLLTLLQPIFSIIGIITNMFTIIVINNKCNKKVFGHSMYRFIQINSSFNIIYCIIMILKLMNTCIFYASSVYCSTIYQNESAQYFKIIIIHFFGNAIKICCNISYLFFSFNRLLLIIIHKSNIVAKKLTKFEIIFYYVSLLCISCFLSSFKLFQYKINSLKDFRKDFPYEVRDEYICDEEINKSDCKLFNSFKISNHILNDVLCVFLNIGIDIFLIRKFHFYLEKKSHLIVDLDQHTNIKKSKKNINRMILWNSILYIISHLPELITSLLLIIFAKEITLFCNFNLSCDIINEEAEFFCLISIVFQFYIFKIFDRNFRDGFNQLKSQIALYLISMMGKKEINLQSKRSNYSAKNLKKFIGNSLID